MSANPSTPPVSATSLDEPIICPFIIAIDQREQMPWGFGNLLANASGERIIVRTSTVHLKTGDYSIVGLESQIAIERKSKQDAYGTFGGGRGRFEAELERLNAMQFAAVVIEDDWRGLLYRPPRETRMKPWSVIQSILAWEQRYPNVHWHCLPTRELAEQVSFDILRRFYLDAVRKKDHSLMESVRGQA